MFVKIKEKAEYSVHMVKKALINLKSRQIPVREILCNQRGAGALDIVLGAMVSVVLVLLVLTALKTLFSVDVLPGLTDKIDTIFS